MGTLFAEVGEGTDYQLKYEAEVYHKQQCNLCPLAKIKNNRHPNMPASGAARPLVYILGEGPGEQEDDEGVQFIGESGQFLRSKIPRDYQKQVRFNNVVRTRPPRNRTPEFPEIECCRPSVVADIEASKPRAIFGFGNIPLQWISEFTGITVWRGRRMPVKVGKHVCWFYPMIHPAYLIRTGRDQEEERMFTMDIKRAFAELSTLPLPVIHSKEDALKGVEILTDVEDIKRALRWASKQPALGIDYETNCLRPYAAGAKVLTAGVGTLERSFAFPIDHPGAPYKGGERNDVIFIWKRFLQQTRAKKISHSLAFELEWTGEFFGQELIRTGEWEDTASQAVVLDERKGGFSLEFLVQQYFGFNLKKLSNVNRARLEHQSVDTVLRYNALDAKYHFLLWEKQKARIKHEGLELAYSLALRRVPTVVLTQMKGLPVNQDTVKQLKKKYEKRIEGLEEDIAAQPIVAKFKKLKGRTYNPASNPDSVYIFWDMLKYIECRVTDKYSGRSKLSVEETILEKIDHPLAKLLVKWRKASRQMSNYILPLQKGSPSSVIYPDGLLHTQFNTIFARTGRLSSDSPNLQNFPKRDDEAKEVRRPIEAKPGELVVAADFGQIEARVIAMFTKDKHFVKALWENYDVHMEWAERIAMAYPRRIGGKDKLKDKKAMKDFRTDIKNQWTFPLFFGARVESAAGYLNIPVETIAPLYRAFWKQFYGVKEWQERQLQFYQDNGYVECLTGRRRYGPLTVNMVYNTPVQGTAAEIVMDAMSRMSELKDLEMQPEINIHDDLTWVRVAEKQLDRHVERALDIMLDVPFDFVNVPITVEVSVGKNWADLHEEGVFSSTEWFKHATKRKV